MPVRAVGGLAVLHPLSMVGRAVTGTTSRRQPARSLRGRPSSMRGPWRSRIDSPIASFLGWGPALGGSQAGRSPRGAGPRSSAKRASSFRRGGVPIRKADPPHEAIYHLLSLPLWRRLGPATRVE